MNDIESRLLDMLTDLLLNATKRVSALEALLKERGGGFNRSSQQSQCESIVERHRAPRRVFASRAFFAAWC